MNEELKTEGSEISVGMLIGIRGNGKTTGLFFSGKSAISDPVDFAKVSWRSVHKDQAEIDV